MRSRVKRICVTGDLEAEEEHLKMTFQKNGYTKGFIAGTTRQRLRQDETQLVEGTAAFNLPSSLPTYQPTINNFCSFPIFALASGT